jgi:hypothetical protein
MGRPSKGGTAVQVRFPDDILAGVDAKLEELRDEHPGMSGITRSDFIRDSVTYVLKVDPPKKLKPRPRAR